MKKFRFSIIAFAALLVLGSCTKHKLWFPMDEFNGAEIQIHYMEPITNVAANYIDSVYVNDVLYSSKDGGGTLYPYNGVPCMDVGKFFGVKAGNINIKFMRGGEVIYDRNITVEAKKQNVIVHDLNADPIILDNKYPYWHDRGSEGATAETWGTDSVCKFMFVNLLYESPGVPYPGKLQYQYRLHDAKEDDPWNNLGDPVGFGEATERVMVTFHWNGAPATTPYQRVDFRILTEDGNELMVLNSKGTMVKYSDYWNANLGRCSMHFMRGYRTTTPVCGVSNWWSL